MLTVDIDKVNEWSARQIERVEHITLQDPDSGSLPTGIPLAHRVVHIALALIVLAVGVSVLLLGFPQLVGGAAAVGIVGIGFLLLFFWRGFVRQVGFLVSQGAGPSSEQRSLYRYARQLEEAGDLEQAARYYIEALSRGYVDAGSPLELPAVVFWKKYGSGHDGPDELLDTLRDLLFVNVWLRRSFENFVVVRDSVDLANDSPQLIEVARTLAAMGDAQANLRCLD